jgi:hypothetical protein
MSKQQLLCLPEGMSSMNGRIHTVSDESNRGQELECEAEFVEIELKTLTLAGGSGIQWLEINATGSHSSGDKLYSDTLRLRLGREDMKQILKAVLTTKFVELPACQSLLQAEASLNDALIELGLKEVGPKEKKFSYAPE